MQPASWRQIETALVRLARGYGFNLDILPKSGDKIAVDAIVVGDTIDSLNLTELAKDLEKELSL